MHFRRRSWPRKFADAFRGLSRAVRRQSSFFVHLWVAAAVVAVAAVLRVSLVEWCLLIGAIGIVLVAEIFNTSIESLARALTLLLDGGLASGALDASPEAPEAAKASARTLVAAATAGARA
jgi:hypothetical protein